MEIKASIVTVDESAPVVIGFADDDKNPVNYLLLQFYPTEQGTPLHVEVNDQIRGGYDLVQRIQLLDSSVVIELTSDGQKVLKTGPTVTVSIAPGVQNWRSIKQKLATLLRRWV